MRLFARVRLSALLLPVLFVPMLAYAALININTADSTLLQTLPGIGPSKATGIIDYRTQHGPFAQIQDIQNVSGIGPSTFANIQALITVGDTIPTSPVSTTTSVSSTTTIVSGAAASTYVPPPPGLSLDVGSDRVALLDVPAIFTAIVKTKSGVIDASAEVVWSFGDGSSTSGRIVEKIYHHAGTYLVVARARDGEATARADLVVTAQAAAAYIVSVAPEGITIENRGKEALELSGWRLASGSASFRFPEGMMILPTSKALFPWAITNLLVANEATLTYPDGVLASRYPAALLEYSGSATTTSGTAAQPPVAPDGSHKVQAVRYDEVASAFSTVSPSPHEPEALDAPAAAPTLAAAGASVPLPNTSRGTLHSGWMFGLLGIIALAGGIFMIL